MANKQTAVEWLLENLIYEPWSEEHFKHNKECWDKAKQMEKDQIIEAALSLSPYRFALEAEQYYNETYGKDSTE